MAIVASDIKFRKSAVVSDGNANGGRASYVEVQSGVRHSLFPRVTKAQRTDGVTRYRKEFWSNEDTGDETAYSTLIWMEHPSNGGDRFYLGKGTQTDVQSALTTYSPAWLGCGLLNANLTAGVSTTVEVQMSNSDYVFPQGGYIHISDKFSTSQTIASGVDIGDSVEWSAGAGEWQLIASTDDVTYPKGLYIGSNTVMTIKGTSNEEWLSLATNQYSDEDIGDGNGSDTSPTLSTLTNNTNGISTQPGYLPVVTATCGGVSRTVNVAADGTCSGYCSAGELNMATGAWTTDITFTTAPDAATDITITYYENNFSYSGNTATVELASGVTPDNSYTASNTYGAGCIDAGDVEASTSDWVESAAGSGTYDESTYPLTLYNDGTVYDTWTLTFTAAGVFSIAGTNEGSVATGQSTGGDVSPVNANTGQPYFTILSAGWSGTWTTGDTITFTTTPAKQPLWLKQVVPASTSAAPNNLFTIGWYTS